MACTVEHQPWSPHRLTGSPYVPRGLSPSRTPKYMVQHPTRRGSIDETVRLSQRCLSCGDESVYVKPSRVDKVVHPASILKPSSSPPTGRRSRHIGFKNEATVHHLGDLGEYLYTDYENVNFEPKPYNIYHRLARLAKLQRHSSLDKENYPPPPSHSFYDDMAIKSKSAANFEHSQLVRSASSIDKDIAISFARDQSGALAMHLSVFVGKEHNPKDVLVKACTSGRKLRVIAGANQDKSSPNSIPTFVRDISLPVEIESLSIRAKMDPKGFLAIEGIVKDLSRKVGSL